MKPALLEGQGRPGLLLTDKGLLLHHLRLHILIISPNIIQLFLYNPTVPLFLSLPHQSCTSNPHASRRSAVGGHHALLRQPADAARPGPRHRPSVPPDPSAFRLELGHVACTLRTHKSLHLEVVDASAQATTNQAALRHFESRGVSGGWGAHCMSATMHGLTQCTA